MSDVAAGFETLCALCAAALRGETRSAADADGLLPLAERHRVVPLLAAGLGSASPLDIRRRALALAQQGIRLEQELASIAKILSGAGVSFLLLKGPGLARQAYPAPEWRTYDDLDLWLERGDLDAAMHALEQAGYRRSPPVDSHIAQSARRAEIDVPYVHPQRGRLVELSVHLHGLVPTRRMKQEVLAGARELDIAGGAIRVPAPVHTLLLSCAHAAHHRWDRLVWVVDVAALWRRLSAAERELAVATAGRWCVGTQLGIGLELARQHLGLGRDDDGADRRAVSARALALARRVQIEFAGPDSLRIPRRVAWQYERDVQDAAWRRWRLWMMGVFSPTLDDLQRHPLPRCLFPLYRLIRPARLLWRLVRWPSLEGR